MTKELLEFEQKMAAFAQAYLDDPTCCPMCKGTMVEGGSFEAEDLKRCARVMTCTGCGSKWSENYAMTGIEIYLPLPEVKK